MNQTLANRAAELVRRFSNSSEFESVSILVENGKLVLRGCVGSYELKHKAEENARAVGFSEIDNCVRVYPCDQDVSPAVEPAPQGEALRRRVGPSHRLDSEG